MSSSSKSIESLRAKILAQASNAVEPLEVRRFLHAGHEHAAHTDDAGTAPAEHMPLSEFVRENPQFASVNVWNPSVFNPTNSTNIEDWLYDPHTIEDDRPVAIAPETPANSGGPEVVRLPDLVPLTTGGALVPSIDKTEIPGHNLMRFTTTIGNQGIGPAILRSNRTGTPPAGSGLTSWSNPDGTQNVLQELYEYNGTNFTFSGYRQAGRMVFHSAHNHFHLEGYASYRLLTNVGGQPGPVAVRSGFDGAPAVGDKVGFCLVNIGASFTMTNGQSSTTLSGYDPVGSQSTASTNGQPQTTCGFLQGIHVGHSDVYSSIYDGQWVDVTGVPNGSYFLEVTLDAQNVIQESDEANNTVLVPYTLNTTANTGGTILPDQYEPNNSFAEATDLGVLGVENRPTLSIHISGESDYFKFVAASAAPGNVQLLIADRDVNLALYDSNFTLLGSSSSAATGTGANPVTETINFTPVAGATYYAKATGFGSDLNPQTSAISGNFAFKVNILPTVSAATADSSAAEAGLAIGRIDIARNGPTSSGLNIGITVGGTATRGVDYEIYHDDVLITGNTIGIGNEASVAQLQIRPLGDALVEATETVTIAVNTGAAYVGGDGANGTVNIADIPPQVVASEFKFDTGPQGVQFDFSLDVSASLSLADIVVRPVGGDPVTLGSVSYVPATNRGTFSFGSILPDANYTATLAAAGVTHAQGAALPADSVVSFFVLAGDATRDRSVNLDDFTALAANFGGPGTFSSGDFNYTGAVNLDDFTILAAQFGAFLPVARLVSARPTSDEPAALVATALPPRSALFGSTVPIGRIFNELEERSVGGLPA